jgi:hypothetical protein
VNEIASTFKKWLDESKLSQRGLILMDDSGAKVQMSSGPQKRETWSALIVPPARTDHSIQQMHGLCDELRSRFNANELHAHELFQRKGPWAAVSIDTLKQVTAAVASILSQENFPIVVQTFWQGNDSHIELCARLGDERIRMCKRKFGIDFRSPKEAAFVFCVWRVRQYVTAEYRDLNWVIFADEGLKRPGQKMEIPALWADGQTATVHLEDSRICQLIQLAEFAAFFMTRSQQIAVSPSIRPHDEELLDILGTSLNYVNIPYKIRARTHRL